MGIDPFLSTSAIGCVVAQRLVRRLCERCREPASVSKTVLRHIGFPFDIWEGEPTFYRPVGCEDCHGDGYHGRVGIFELMAMNDELEALALSRSSAAEIERAAVKGGMVKMRAEGLLKAARSITTIEEILRTTV